MFNKSNIKNKIKVLVFLIILNLIFLFPLLQGSTFIGGDIRNFVLQANHFYKTNSNWNNLQYCGIPSYINYSGLDYIFSFTFLDNILSFKIAFIFHIIILQIFLYKLFSLYSKNKIFILAGAIAGSFSGYITNLFLHGHNTFLYPLPWSIAIIYSSILFIRKKNLLPLFILPLFIYLQVTGGNLYLVALSFILYVIIYLYEIFIFNKHKHKKLLWRSFIIFLIVAGSYMLFSYSIIKTLYLMKESIKSQDFTYQQSKRYSYTFSHILQSIIPKFFGSIKDKNFWDNTYENISGNIPILLIFLLLNTSYFIIRQKRILVLIICSLFFMLIAMADIFPVYKFLYTIIPGFNKFRAPVRFLMIYSFLNALLIVLLLDTLQKSKIFLNNKINYIIIGLSIITVLVINFIPLLKYLDITNHKFIFFYTGLTKNITTVNKACITWIIIFILYTIFNKLKSRYKNIFILSVLIFELVLNFYSYSYIKISKPKIYNNNFLSQLTKLDLNNRFFFNYDYTNINDNLLYLIKSIRAYSPSLPNDFVNFIKLLPNQDNDISYEKLSNRMNIQFCNSPIIDMMNSKYIVSKKVLDSSYLKPIKIDSTVNLYENKQAWNFIEVFNSWDIISESDIDTYLINIPNGTKKLAVMKPYKIKQNSIKKSNYQIKQYSEYINNKGKFTIFIQINTNNFCMVFLPVMYNKNFKLKINNGSQKILKVNKIFIGIPIQTGQSNIILTYDPPKIYNINLIIMGIIFIGLGFVLFKKI